MHIIPSRIRLLKGSCRQILALTLLVSLFIPLLSPRTVAAAPKVRALALEELSSRSPVGINRSAANAPQTITYFGDDFNDDSIDSSKWGAFEAWGSGTRVEQNQRLEVAPSLSAWGGGVFTSAATHDVRGRTVTFKLGGYSSSHSQKFEFHVHDLGIASDMWVIVSSGWLSFMSNRYPVGQDNDGNFAYNGASPIWIRFRQSGGQFFWDTSTDGQNWTNRITRNTWATLSATQRFKFLYETNGGGPPIWIDDFVTDIPPPNQLPIANAGGPHNAPTGTAIQFNASASNDPDGTIVNYQWNFGDGATGSGVSPTHTYSSPGTYTVGLTVTDNSGGTNSASATATITNRAPTANAGGPYNGSTGTALQFDGTSSADPDGTIASYQWDFGDGTTGTGATPTHTFTSAGTYNIGLTVTDNLGATASATTTAAIANQQAATNVDYRYDELGRLTAVVTPTGDTATYTYDAVGNLLSIGRYSASQTSIISFSPNNGPAGTSVSIYGTGFSTTANQNTVTFNGTAATVVTATSTRLVVSVPSGAVTGPIAVTSPAGSATSSTSFTIGPNSSKAPTITAFTPTNGSAGTTLTITGTNFETALINNRVKVNANHAKVTAATATSLMVSVPSSSSGRISVATPYGSAQSIQDFLIAPVPYTVADMEITDRMNIGDTRTVTINNGAKNAMILFDGTAGQRVSVKWSGVTFGDSTLTIYKPDGMPLGSSARLWLPGGSNQLFIEPRSLPVTGTYTILIDPTAAGSGSLTLYDVPPDITGPITLGGASVPATISTAGQNAKLTFTGTAGQRVSMRVIDTAIPSSFLSINKPDGTMLGQRMTIVPGRGAQEYFYEPQTLPSSGNYTVLIDPELTNTGGITVQIYNVPADVTGALTIGGQALTVSISAPGQNGVLSFEGMAGQQVTIRLANNTVGRTSVWIYRPDGSSYLSYMTEESSNNYTINSLPVTGTYQIVINPDYHLTGSMSMSLTTP